MRQLIKDGTKMKIETRNGERREYNCNLEKKNLMNIVKWYEIDLVHN